MDNVEFCCECVQKHIVHRCRVGFLGTMRWHNAIPEEPIIYTKRIRLDGKGGARYEWARWSQTEGFAK